MPPKTGGGGNSHDRRNHSADARSRAKASKPSMGHGGRSLLALRPAQSIFSIAPLILEGVSINKMLLNDLIKQNFGDVKINNIQCSRTGTFTIQAGDVKSFNLILNELPVFLSTNGFAAAKLFVPRSIQRIKDTEKVAFVKRVDIEIPDNRILAAIKDAGIDVLNVARLNGKDGKTPTQTLRITFADVANRNTFVKTGLQVEYMHFEAESASHNTKPTQCFLCLKYNHVAKYCKTNEQRCARCGDNHRKDQCNVTNDQVKCFNCKGKHEATSNDCPWHQEQAKKMKIQVEKYSSSSRMINTPPLPNDKEYPPLPNILDQRNIIDEIVNVMSKKMEKMLEESTLRLFYKLEKRIEKIEKSLGIKTISNDNNTDNNTDMMIVDNNIDNIIDNIVDPVIDNNIIDHNIDKNLDAAQVISDSESSEEEGTVLKFIKEKQAVRKSNINNTTSRDVIPKPKPTSRLPTISKPQKKKSKTKRGRSHDSSLEVSSIDV